MITQIILGLVTSAIVPCVGVPTCSRPVSFLAKVKLRFLDITGVASCIDFLPVKSGTSYSEELSSTLLTFLDACCGGLLSFIDILSFNLISGDSAVQNGVSSRGRLPDARSAASKWNS